MKNHLSRFIILLIAGCFIFNGLLLPVLADTLPESEIRALDNYPNWVGSCGSAIDNLNTTTKTSGPVYIMGDSITELSKDAYRKKFSNGGWIPTIEGLTSRHIVGTPPSPDGVGQIKESSDKEAIGKAEAIVIALGTNDSSGSASSIKQNVIKLMDQLKSENTGSAPIYWVNILDTRSDADSTKTNQAIEDGVGSDGTVINWYETAKGTPNGADLSSFSGGVHPTKQKDIDLLVNLVYDSVSSTNGSESSGTRAETCTCSSDGSSSSALSGRDNTEKTWNFFKSKNLSDKQVAGIMGNITQESHFDPQIMQKGGRSKNPADADPLGWGIIQWSSPASKVIGLADKTGMVEPLKGQKVTGPIYELPTQLDLVWHHMNNDPVVTQPFDLAHFKTLGDEVEAAVYFGEKIEGFGIAGDRWQDATDALNKYGGSGGGAAPSSGGVDCAAGNASSPDCATASGNAKILCEAKKYDPVSYVWGGGHAGGTPYHQACSTIKPGDACGLDCSGLVSVAVYDAFGGSGGLAWDTNSLRGDTTHWKEVSFSTVQPGDVMEPDAGHVEIIDHVMGNKIYTFGAHSASYPQPKQVGPTNYSKNDAIKYYRYVGPGSS